MQPVAGQPRSGFEFEKLDILLQLETCPLIQDSETDSGQALQLSCDHGAQFNEWIRSVLAPCPCTRIAEALGKQSALWDSHVQADARNPVRLGSQQFDSPPIQTSHLAELHSGKDSEKMKPFVENALRCRSDIWGSTFHGVKAITASLECFGAFGTKSQMCKTRY